MKKKRARKLARQVERAQALALNKVHMDNKARVLFLHSQVQVSDFLLSGADEAPYKGELITGEVGTVDCGITIISSKTPKGN